MTLRQSKLFSLKLLLWKIKILHHTIWGKQSILNGPKSHLLFEWPFYLIILCFQISDDEQEENQNVPGRILPLFINAPQPVVVVQPQQQYGQPVAAVQLPQQHVQQQQAPNQLTRRSPRKNKGVPPTRYPY